MTFRTCAAALLVAGLFPATAGAATVSVVEETVSPFPPQERATLLFEAAAGEDNIASIVPAGEESGEMRYEVTDLHEPLAAGPGCSGGGGPGVSATCVVPRSRPASGCGHLGCSDMGRLIVFRFLLGDGDDQLRATGIPADDGGGGSLSIEAEGGTGDDQLYPGPTSDRIDPGPGSDSVRSNQGNDFVDAGDSPDGADRFDLREGFDTISYADAAQPVSISIDSRANDGAAGEGDEIEGAEELIGTPGPDRIVGGDGTVLGSDGFAEGLMGNGGGDVLVGNGGPDLLYTAPLVLLREYSVGGSGARDVLRGGAGDDELQAFAGNDTAAGGGGDDVLYGMDGADLARGGKGRDIVDGGEDADRLGGGSGRDRLDAGVGVGDAQDGATDRLDCGPSRHDHAFDVERRDRVDRCERVRSGTY
ncbi:MAG: hypothetical protein QOI10_2034 [Solirubrobacterales bacterium]|jgi:Ca2+-binding RTX toxin-like protein|nr:hypothetical protein [Solirubrobacterales bacterium]